jgi:hypothetical protein
LRAKFPSLGDRHGRADTVFSRLIIACANDASSLALFRVGANNHRFALYLWVFAFLDSSEELIHINMENDSLERSSNHFSDSSFFLLAEIVIEVCGFNGF